jgi:GMP synthase-like glutamine amidotransferase
MRERKMKVLIIDNTRDLDSWGSSDLRSFVTAAPDRTAFVRRAPENDLPDSIRGYDRIILSGSRTSCLEEGAWVTELDGLLKEALRESRPILGVCYGHQALNRVLGGRSILRTGHPGEFGWTEIEIVERAPLFDGLNDKFWSFSSHYEEVSELPKGMRLLAKSSTCAIQACRLEDLPVYGIQFHPEKDLPSTAKSIEGWKKDDRRDKISHPKGGAQLYDPKVGQTIFGNFLSENV